MIDQLRPARRPRPAKMSSLARWPFVRRSFVPRSFVPWSLVPWVAFIGTLTIAMDGTGAGAAHGADPVEQVQTASLADGAEVPSLAAGDPLPAGADPLPVESVPLLVATTTMLGAAVSELAGDWSRLEVLIPGEGCPGHFDLAPGDLQTLRRAALVLRHDYQGTMQQRLEAAGTTVPFVALPTRGTQTLPENFLALCADLAGELAKSFPDRAAAIEHALDSTRTRVGRLAERELARSRPRLHGVPLLVASFQSDFVSWAGAEVVSEFEPAEEASLADLKATVERARANGARGVVGNLQWGDREVRSLGESLGRPVVLLSNFPADTRPGAYARLLRSNLEQLYLLLGDS